MVSSFPSSYRRTNLKRLGRRLLEQPEEPPVASASAATLLFCQDLLDIQQNCTELGLELTHKCGETLLSTTTSKDDEGRVVLDYNIAPRRHNNNNHGNVAQIREKARAMQQQQDHSLVDTTTYVEQHPSKMVSGQRSPVEEEDEEDELPLESRQDMQEELEHLNELMIMAREQEQALRDLLVVSDDELPWSKTKSKSKTLLKRTTGTKRTESKVSSIENAAPFTKNKSNTEKKQIANQEKMRKKTVVAEKTPSKKTPAIIVEEAPMKAVESSSRVPATTSHNGTAEEVAVKKTKSIPENQDLVEGTSYGTPIAIPDADGKDELAAASIHKSPTEMKRFLQEALATDTRAKQTVVHTKKTKLANIKKKGAAFEARKHRMDAIIAMQQGGTTTASTTKSRGSVSTNRGMEPPAMQKGKYVDVDLQHHHHKTKTKRPDTTTSQRDSNPDEQRTSDNEVSSRSRTTIASTGEEHLKELTKRIAEASKSIRKDASVSSPVPADCSDRPIDDDETRDPASRDPHSTRRRSTKSRPKRSKRDPTVSTTDNKSTDPAASPKSSSRRQSRRQHDA